MQVQKQVQSAEACDGAPCGSDAVAVVITTFNHAEFLGDALASVFSQTRPADEVIVVDDGSLDDPAAVVARFPTVRLARFANAGLSTARNRGAELADSDYVIFLDADDVLRPQAIEAGLACMAANPGAGFVYGGYRLVDAELKNAAPADLKRVGPRAYYDLLNANMIGMHGAVLYDRKKLLRCGGFDPSLERCEDYDMYLRMAERHRVASHSEPVADYRIHSGNMSASVGMQLTWAIDVHTRNRPAAGNPEALAEWEAGQRFLKRGFSHAVWSSRPGMPAGRRWAQRAEMMSIAPRMVSIAALRQFVISHLPQPIVSRLRQIRRMTLSPRRGGVNFGDFARIAPLSAGFGYKRGTPVDRWYVEDFLARHAGDIAGHVLEIGDASYSRRFGANISRQDVLNLRPDQPETTIVGDLAEAGVLEEASFDCMIVTPTLHLIYDLRAAVRQLHRALRPGGVVLATVPGISPVDPGEWGETWYWTLTGHSARRLFEEEFGADNVEVEVEGNAFAATCFLQGVALEDVGENWLRPADPSYPVIVAIRARRPNVPG